ncbi:MAG TPA: tetratricopeptide repeat protein, partial [Acidobacteriota bacterium]|nr:tetratricopeptide repeat protein [Acidobacteriota bacterium]
VADDIEKAIETYQLWKQTYPRDFTPPNNLANRYDQIGQFDKGAEEAREALRREPNHPFPYSHLARAYMGLNRFDEAKAIIQKALALKLEILNFHILLYGIAFLQGDSAEMQRQLDWMKGKPQEYFIFSLQAATAQFSGKLRQAREFSRKAIELAQRGNFKEPAAIIAAGQALAEANFGNFREARDRAAEALAIARSEIALFNAANALALSGAVDQGQTLMEEAGTRFPADTIFNNVALPIFRARFEIDRGNPEKAIQLLQPAQPYEIGYLAVPYVRGQAYLRLRKGSEAAAEFQRILDHKGALFQTNPPYIFAMAQLGLGRAWAVAGDIPKSRKAYQDFLALWKDADPDIPILQQAKQEYAKLQAGQ